MRRECSPYPVAIGEEGNLSPTSSEVESPRKRMRLDNSTRKGWSLMDRRADQEVLQEMGVSILEPDDGEPLCDTTNVVHKSTQKRKLDIENVNPNVNLSSSSSSPRHKAKSPRAKCSSPRHASPRKPLQPTEQALEMTIISEYLIEEETPLAQSISAHPPGPGFSADYSNSSTDSSGKKRFTPLGLEEDHIISRRSKSEPVGEDSFSVLSDEMLLSVFRWLPKRTLAHGMMVCKRWHRVACDETLWQRLDLGNKALSKDALGRILARKPVIVRLASSEIGEWHPPAPIPSRVQYLDLSMTSTDRLTLNNLLASCPLLKKLSLENVTLHDEVCQLIGKCSNLETLNLTMAQGITAEGLTSLLEGCSSLQSVNISWCNLSESALQVLVTRLPQRLQRLNVAGARIMTDEMVASLVDRCPRLLELDLSDCSRLGAAAVTSVLSLNRLEHLALSRCYLLPPHVLTKLSSMSSLQYVEVWGMLQAASQAALRAALPAIQVNQFMFSAIARPTVGTRRTSIWGLRTRD